MNYKITLSKNSNELVNVKINEENYTLYNTITTIDINTDQLLITVARHEDGLYQTDKLTHDTYITVEQILIDNFWSIGHNNHWSKTVYDQQYRDHLADKSVTWELSKDLYNNVLFFNGCLEYHITKPIRGMFFK
jgi:hypothetical protein